jgi:hypothetical protein
VSTQITDSATTQEIQASPFDALMRAFATAESIVSSLPFRPSSVTLNGNAFDTAYQVILYFHREPGRVREFAAAHGVEVTAVPNHNERAGWTHEYADVEIDGIQVNAWSLTEDAAAEVAA